MKNKIKLITICVLVMIMVFSFATTVFANDITRTAYYSASVCTNQFTTSDYITKYWDDYQIWEKFYVKCDSVSFANTSLTKYLQARPVDTTGQYAKNSFTRVNNASTSAAIIRDDDVNAVVKMVIKNPYGPGGSNMVCKGSFWGYYS